MKKFISMHTFMLTFTIVSIFQIVPAKASEALHVEGEKASQLLSSMQDAGAQGDVIPEIIHLKAVNLSCTRGIRFEMQPYFQCTFEQTRPQPPLGTIESKKFEITGLKALHIIQALRDAGVKGEGTIAKTTFSVASLSCDGRYFGQHTYEECRLDFN